MSIAPLCANSKTGDICIHTKKAADIRDEWEEFKKKNVGEFFVFPYLRHLQNRNSSELSTR